MLSFSGVTIICLLCSALFRFHIFIFIEAAAFDSIVPWYACAPTATRRYLTTVCGHDFIFLIEQPQNLCQLSDVLDPLLAAPICCYRGRHRRNAVIYVCLQTTRGPCLKAGLNSCVRQSEGRLRISARFF